MPLGWVIMILAQDLNEMRELTMQIYEGNMSSGSSKVPQRPHGAGLER